jgi:hypothetical protein
MKCTKASTTWNRSSPMHVPMYADDVTHTYPGAGEVFVEVSELQNGYVRFKCDHNHYDLHTVCIEGDIRTDYDKLSELIRDADPYQLELFVGMLFDQLVRYDPSSRTSCLTYDTNQQPDELGEAVSSTLPYLQSPGFDNGWSGEASIAPDAEYTHGGNLNGWEIAAFVHPLKWRKKDPKIL